MAPALPTVRRRYLITLDGSRYFSSEQVHCEHCLTTTKGGITRFHHDILQAAIVHPDKPQVLPLAPEFVRNSDAKGGTYDKQACVEQLTAKRFSFLLVAKPGDHTSLYQDVDGLRRGNLLNRHATDHRGERREYEWVTDMPLNGQPDSPLINFIQFRIVKDGKIN